MEAHNGLQVPEEYRKYMGIFIPGMGIFRSTVGQFGIKTVALVYNKAMFLSLGNL